MFCCKNDFLSFKNCPIKVSLEAAQQDVDVREIGNSVRELSGKYEGILFQLERGNPLRASSLKFWIEEEEGLQYPVIAQLICAFVFA